MHDPTASGGEFDSLPGNNNTLKGDRTQQDIIDESNAKGKKEFDRIRGVAHAQNANVSKQHNDSQFRTSLYAGQDIGTFIYLDNTGKVAVWRIGGSDVLAGAGYPYATPSIGAFSVPSFEKGAFALIITPAPRISSLINVNANHKIWNTLSRNTNAPVFVYPRNSAEAVLFCPACRTGENFIRK